MSTTDDPPSEHYPRERITADDENPIKKKKEKLVKVEECTIALDTLPKPSEEELNPYLIFPSPEENYKVA
ncbi:hypothetical protein ACSBR2_014866 [Camellia fascicularis]